VSKRDLIACFGECMVELRPAGAGLWQQAYAGDVCNTAIYLARLLAGYPERVSWVSATGSDLFAPGIRQFWQSEGLHTELTVDCQNGTTGLYAIQLDGNGERQFSYWRQQSAARYYFVDRPLGQTPLELSLDGLLGFHFSAISLAILPTEHRMRLLNIAAALRTQGAWISFDSNYRPSLWESAEAAQYWMRLGLRACDRAFISIDDWIGAMKFADELAAWFDLTAHSPTELVVKRGGQDTWLSLHGGEMQCIAVDPIAHPIDTTAAGDAFAGAYLAARIRGLPPQEAVIAGHKMAASVIMQPGAIMAAEHMPAFTWSRIPA
jgi:2-dehydro-3-deoxygluconokinase